MDYCTILYDVDGESIVPSIVWLETPEYRFQDLSSMLYAQAMRFIKEYMFTTNNLLNGLCLDQNQSASRELCDRLHLIISDEMSMVAINKSTKQIVGLAINKIMSFTDYCWTQWKLMMPENVKLKELFTLQYDMQFACDLRKIVDNSACFHVFYLIVRDSSKTEDNYLRKQLLLQAEKEGRKLRCGYLTYLATSKNEQNCAENVGMMSGGQKSTLAPYIEVLVNWKRQSKMH